jgi:tetratricopeptide (TPR) repeat protein
MRQQQNENRLEGPPVATQSPGLKSLILVALFSLGAAGCTVFEPYERPEREPPSRVAVPDRPPEPREAEIPPREENVASVALLEQGRDERAAGSYAAAAASIERALRIDPNNPLLWIELAEVKAAEGDDEQAEMMARKALTLAGPDRSITARAERLVDR